MYDKFKKCNMYNNYGGLNKMPKCINCIKFLDCGTKGYAKEGEHNCSYYIHRYEEIEKKWLEKQVKEMLEDE